MTKTNNFPHKWKIVESGMYDTTFECGHCNASHYEQSDVPASYAPVFGCISNDFTATKLVAEGTMEVEVTSFNGKMAICSDEEGCVLITREQAIKFFNL